MEGRDDAWRTLAVTHVFQDDLLLPPSFLCDFGYGAAHPRAPFKIEWTPGKGWGVFMTRRFRGRLTWYGMVTFWRQARLGATRNAAVQVRQARGDFSHRATARGEVDHCGL